MKSLDQIEARTPISSAPYTISTPRSYYLSQNLSVSDGDAITITAKGVPLDLNGFTISSTAPNATGTAIFISGGVGRDITIRNGMIQSGVTQTDGVYSGSGFANGIDFNFNTPRNVLVSAVLSEVCRWTASMLAPKAAWWRRAVSTSPAASDPREDHYRQCRPRLRLHRDLGGFGPKFFRADQRFSYCAFRNQRAELFWVCVWFWDRYRRPQGGKLPRQSVSGIGLNAVAATNCSGTSLGTAVGNDGLRTETANASHGSSAAGKGISAKTVSGCFGQSSSSGNGIDATMVSGSWGTSQSGRGISASSIQTSYGSSTSTHGLFADQVANSYGRTTSGPAAIYGLVVSFSYGHHVNNTGPGITGVNAIGCWGLGSPAVQTTGGKFLGTP